MLFSSLRLKTGQTYNVFTGGTNINGLYTSGTYSGGTQSTTFTTSSMVTKAGGNTGP